MLKLTVASTRHYTNEVEIWFRMHGIELASCGEVRVFPRLRLAAFWVYDRTADGHFFARRYFPFIEFDPSASWWLRWLRLPPTAEWCERC